MKHYNVLMVLADQHNASQLAVAGHPQAITPHLDRFAGQGVRFTNAYTQNTICTPSRVSILSGQYCHNHGYYGLSGPIKPNLDNLFRRFKAAGYRTAGYGKLHLPDSPRNWIADDLDFFGDSYETEDGVVGESKFLSYLEERGLRSLEDSWHNADEYGPGTISHDAMPSKLPYEHTQEMWCADRAMEFMQESEDTPFFIQVAFQKPHHPLLPNQQFWDMYPEDIELPPTSGFRPDGRPPHFRAAWERFQKREWDYGEEGDTPEDGARRAWRGTLACVTQVDDVFGRLLDYLDESGKAANTIVIYAADHGGYHGIHGIEEKAPGICSEAVCRIPMIWRVPGVTPSNAVSSALVESVDFAATLPALCGIDPMERVDGKDLRELLSAPETAAPAHSCAVTENVYAKSVRWDQWRMVYYPDEMFGGNVYGELYDVESDPEERENLYGNASFQGVIVEGMRRLTNWLITTSRIVTTQPTMQNDDSGGRHIHGSRSYPLCTDGTSPDWVQPRNRENNNINYL